MTSPHFTHGLAARIAEPANDILTLALHNAPEAAVATARLALSGLTTDDRSACLFYLRNVVTLNPARKRDMFALADRLEAEVV